jgi:hypothetical protein
VVELSGRFWLYYGAGDGVIGAAWADRDALEIMRRAVEE